MVDIQCAAAKIRRGKKKHRATIINTGIRDPVLVHCNYCAAGRYVITFLTSMEGTGLGVRNVTVHLTATSVPIATLLFNGLYGCDIL